jgi:hypothetical protein
MLCCDWKGGGEMPGNSSKYVEFLEGELRRLREEAAKYPQSGTQQDEVLLHFIRRADQIVSASILAKDYPTPLQVMSRVLCEDLFLIAWIAQSEGNSVEYEAGANSEMVKMMLVHLADGRAVIQNRHTGDPAPSDFMKTELIPQLERLKVPRANIEQTARKLGLQRVYDILYRAASLEVHGNTFGISSVDEEEQMCEIALSSLTAVLECIVAIVAFPRRHVSSLEIFKILRLDKLTS